jgi:hypothetical protein
MKKKRYRIHLIKTIHKIHNTEFTINNGWQKSNKTRITNQVVKQGCTLSPTLFNKYTDAVTVQWRRNTSTEINIG